MIDRETPILLLIEDEPRDADQALQTIKQANPNISSFVVRSAEDAWDFLFSEGAFRYRTKKWLPKVILLDLGLPGMNGFELLKKLKDSDRTKDIPLAILTASDDDWAVDIAYQLGADSYIVKPLKVEDFRKLFARKPREQVSTTTGEL